MAIVSRLPGSNSEYKVKKNDTGPHQMPVSSTSAKMVTPEHIFATTHPGLVREANEDSFVYCSVENGRNTLTAVADGIGGHENGDIASRLCLKTILLEWRKLQMWNEKSLGRILAFLDHAITEANATIYRLNLTFNVQQPMGTTLVVGILMPKRLVVAHAGDSRCYKLEGGRIKQLTRDHSFVEELIIKNIITREEAKGHPFSHVISRCVGTSQELIPEINSFRRNGTEKLFLCSDGLNCHLENEQIEEIMLKSASVQESVRNLLYAALKKGGDDNITILGVSPTSV